MADAPPELVEELYGVPADEFIAKRDAKAKELRKSDRAVADAVKKLRKPSVSAGVVNRLARVASEEMSTLLTAGEALREAQLGGGDRDAIRSAASDERAAVERLLVEAGRVSPAVAEEVRGTLHAAASDDETRELVRRGVLTEARAPLGFGLGGFVPGPAKGRVSNGSQAEAAAESRSRPDAAAEAERAAAAAAEAERLEAERAAEAERKAAAAERKRAAKQRVKEARAALREAEKALRAAERERDRAAKELAKVEAAAESA